MEYKFYGNEVTDEILNNSEIRPDIRNPKQLYDALLNIWCEYTCAPRLREEWSLENITVGQCSITAFLCQDIFGGVVYGLKTPTGGIHCYNVIDGKVFDLTSEQFGEDACKLCYDLDVNEVQTRDMAHHFGKEEKKLRYEYLREHLMNL